MNIDFNNTYTRQLVQTFHESASKGFDYGLEIKTNSSELLDNDAYFNSGENTYLAEALPFNESLKIPLHFNIQNETPIRVRIADIQNFDSNQPIYIVDNKTNTYTDLRNENFEINLSTGNYSERFEIVFSQQTLTTIDTKIEDLTVFQDINQSQLRILNPNLQEISSIYIYDILGKYVTQRKQLPNYKEHQISTKNFSNGIYVVKITFKNKKTITKKVIIN